jgi:tRNA(adenine34) deaminase
VSQVHQQFMAIAMSLARRAASLGEVPVGALVVVDGTIVGQGLNTRELQTSVLAHAELNAIKDASNRLGQWRLTGATVYSTLEPCIMCAGALVHARIEHLVYGAADPKFGGIQSLYTIAADPRLNHRFNVTAGVMAQESSQILKDFFMGLRCAKDTP